MNFGTPKVVGIKFGVEVPLCEGLLGVRQHPYEEIIAAILHP